MNAGYENQFVAESYDHVAPYQARQDRKFFVEAAAESGGAVLELGCGTGRILIPIARAGVEVTGIDASEPMLDVCRKRLEEESEEVRSRIHLMNGRMQDFGLDKKFNLITAPFRPFQHLLTVEDQMACLRQVHAHLRDGGTFILDVFNPWVHKLVEPAGVEGATEPEFAMPDGRRVTRKNRVVGRDLFNQTIDIEMIYEVIHPDGAEERIVEPFSMRYLYRFEAEHLLARCGFEVQVVYADYDKSPYGSKYPGELIILARKV